MNRVALAPFRLERYLSRWEFVATHLLGSSDVEGWRMDELLVLADDEMRQLWRELRLGYTEAAGLPLLRRAIAELYPGLSAEDVLTFTGAEEAIFAVLCTLLAPGDHVVVTAPAYTSLAEVARHAGAEVTWLPLREESGWALDVAALERALRRTTRLVVWNFPHNPTGALPDRETQARALAVIQAHGARLFSDEVYRLLELDPRDRLPAAAELDARAVSLGVLSKAFGLAGLRVGWIATRDEEVRSRVAAFKDYLSICSSAPSEILGTIALRARETVLARSHAIVAAGRAAAEQFFAAWPEEFAWTPPRAGTVAFPRLLRRRSAERLAEDLVSREGVLVVPGALFDHDDAHFRVGLGRTNVAESFERFDRFLRRHPEA